MQGSCLQDSCATSPPLCPLAQESIWIQHACWCEVQSSNIKLGQNRTGNTFCKAKLSEDKPLAAYVQKKKIVCLIPTQQVAIWELCSHSNTCKKSSSLIPVFINYFNWVCWHYCMLLAHSQMSGTVCSLGKMYSREHNFLPSQLPQTLLKWCPAFLCSCCITLCISFCFFLG